MTINRMEPTVSQSVVMEWCSGCGNRTKAIVEVLVNGQPPVVVDGESALVVSGCSTCRTGIYA